MKRLLILIACFWQSCVLVAGAENDYMCSSIEDLLFHMRDDDLQVALGADSEILRRSQSDERVVRQLILFLDSEDQARCHDAASLLGRIGSRAKPAIPHLVRLLENNPNVGIKMIAANSLGLIGEEATPLLVNALRNSKDAEIRRWSCNSLRLTRSAFAAKALVETLADSNSDLRANASEALEQLGKIAVPELTIAMKDVNERRAVYACDVLVRIDSAKFIVTVMPVVLHLLHAEDVVVRAQAGHCLCRMGNACKTALPDLAKNLKDDNDDVRYSAAMAIEATGADAIVVLPELLAAVQDKNEHVRFYCVTALGNIGPQAGGIIPSLINVLSDDDESVAHQAAQALNRFGPAVEKSLPPNAKARYDELLKEQQ